MSEASLRVYERIRYGAPWGCYDRDRTLWVQDQAGSWGRPHARFKDITLNSMGLRGPEVRFGTTRIVCIGASETFGLYESPGNEYPRQLERLLNSGYASPRYDVLNLSQSGTRLEAFAARLPDFAARVHPAMALIYPSPGAYIGLPSQFQVARSLPDHAFLQLRSYTYVRELFRAVAPVDLKSLVYRALTWLEQRGWPPLTVIPPDWIRRLRTDLQQTVSLLRQAGVEPVLLTHASPFGSRLDDHDQALLIQWRRFNPAVSESALLDMEARSNESIRQLAQQEQIQLIDVGERLDGCRDCFVDFVHFTDLGAAKVAALLKASLEFSLNQHYETAAHASEIRGQ